MFIAYPTYNWLRPLRYIATAPQQGEDVYALQRTANSILHLDGDRLLKPDGILGPKTGAKIAPLQTALSLELVDGVAGGVTQREICLFYLASLAQDDLYRVCRGLIEHESSNRVGAYSPKRDDSSSPSGWSYDAGCCQMNSAHNDVKVAFEPQLAIGILVQKTRDAYAAYKDTSLFKGSDHSDFRRWCLAAGHWNAPAFANYYAGIKPDAKPSDSAAALFEAYMLDAMAFWGP